MSSRRAIRVARAGLLVLAVGAAVACGDDAGSSAGAFPDVAVLDAEGEKISSSAILRDGRPAVVSVWATSCAPCKEELPRLDALAASRPGLDVAGVNLGDEQRAIDGYVASLGLRMPVYVDHEGRFAEALGVVGLPATVFVDGDGRIVELHLGELNAADLDAAAARLLQLAGATS
jgi:thiol-disulfide isomerase/thioredoxin